MSLLITYNDQQLIKPISANNEEKWTPIANEVQLTKLKELLPIDFYYDLIANPTNEWYAKLIAGGTYTVGNVTYEFAGLKTVLAFFIYERYISESAVNDTYSGFVFKNNDDSRAMSWAEKKNLMSEVRTVAKTHFDDCWRFVMNNASNFIYYGYTSNDGIYTL